jgi:hypothetical protein
MHSRLLTVLTFVTCLAGCGADARNPTSSAHPRNNEKTPSNVRAILATPSDVTSRGQNSITVHLHEDGTFSAGAFEEIDIDFNLRQMAEAEGRIELVVEIEFPVQTTSRVLLSAVEKLRAAALRSVPSTRDVWIMVIAREDLYVYPNE